MSSKTLYLNKTRDDFLKDAVKDLIHLRHEHKMTQEELNHRLGVADRLVNKWECGLRTPTSFNLYCWADALDAKLKIIANDNVSPQADALKLSEASNDNHKDPTSWKKLTAY
ncbi:helix-turn-helix transcriptional regulator [Fulvivirgaceae bacterium BMA10]|uniref:Helix-turn-helix transcriptional regulator n=1 Tax=Splendidivirga corallicola TaxID=3051826 RepID=A0ABT8KLA2_9BACT|nr:helix-turn-helix transcriptional regulator [Fulvivirgaceae bacterium BMA10]